MQPYHYLPAGQPQNSDPTIGEVLTCSRDVTLVYHLTRDWTEEMGGCFVDLEAAGLQGRPAVAELGARVRTHLQAPSKRLLCQQPCPAALPCADARGRQRIHVPQFNSAVLFRVPRYHSVTPVATDRPR